MTKGFLLRKIAVIHAIKCNRTLDDNKVSESYDRLNELRHKITAADDNTLSQYVTEIDEWAGTVPIASNQEIEILFSQK